MWHHLRFVRASASTVGEVGSVHNTAGELALLLGGEYSEEKAFRRRSPSKSVTQKPTSFSLTFSQRPMPEAAIELSTVVERGTATLNTAQEDLRRCSHPGPCLETLSSYCTGHVTEMQNMANLRKSPTRPYGAPKQPETQNMHESTSNNPSLLDVLALAEPFFPKSAGKWISIRSTNFLTRSAVQPA